MTDSNTLPPPTPIDDQLLDEAFGDGYDFARRHNTYAIFGIPFLVLCICIVLFLIYDARQRNQIDELKSEISMIDQQLDIAQDDLILHLLNILNLSARLEDLEQRLSPVSPCPYEKLASTTNDDCVLPKPPQDTVADASLPSLPVKPGEWTGQP